MENLEEESSENLPVDGTMNTAPTSTEEAAGEPAISQYWDFIKQLRERRHMRRLRNYYRQAFMNLLTDLRDIEEFRELPIAEQGRAGGVIWRTMPRDEKEIYFPTPDDLEQLCRESPGIARRRNIRNSRRNRKRSPVPSSDTNSASETASASEISAGQYYVARIGGSTNKTMARSRRHVDRMGQLEPLGEFPPHARRLFEVRLPDRNRKERKINVAAERRKIRRQRFKHYAHPEHRKKR